MIESLYLRNYRNFSEVSTQLSPKVNIFLGDNGQGKTNLLEALALLTSGQSFRYGDNENFIRQGESECFLEAQAKQGELLFELQLFVLKSRKAHLLNGKKATSGEISARFPNVIFSPESLSAIKEGADQRRQLIDELIVSFHPRNALMISEYRRALKTRNKILKNFQAGEVPRSETEHLLESLNPSFLKLATELVAQRLEALRAIHSDFNQAMKSISNRFSVDISVDYVMSNEQAFDFQSKDIENSLVKRLKELHDAELATGASLVGPHKHDVVFLYDQNDSRFYCSQGQQRALILSFKMAQIVYHRRIHGTYPALMLDDVLSELDAEKRDSLIRFLGEIDTQIFITTTDFSLPNSMKSDDCAVLRIREGQIGLF